MRFGLFQFKITLAAGGYMHFFDKLCTKYHDYLDLISIDLMKNRHSRLSRCGIEEFEKSSTNL